MPIYDFNDWSSPVLVSHDFIDNFQQISVTSLNNETIYVAVRYSSDFTVGLISTNDFITFTDEGQFTPENSGQPISAYEGFTIFAANDPNDPDGPEILWFHWIDRVYGIPYISYTSPAEPRVLNTPFAEIGNVTLKTQLGVTSAVNIDGSNAMLMRVGSAQTSFPSFYSLYYSMFDIKTMTVYEDEIQLTGLDSSVAQTAAMPTIVSSRYAGDVIRGKTLAVVWANYGDRLIYSFAGSPF